MFRNKADKTGNHWLMLRGAVPGYIVTIVWLVVFLLLSPAVGAADGERFALHRNSRKAEGLSGSLLKFSTTAGETVTIVLKGTKPSRKEIL